MEKTIKEKDNKISFEFILGDNDIKALDYLLINNYIEFRGKDYTSNDDKMLEGITSLVSIGVVEMDEDAWHQTYVMTKYGKEIFKSRMRQLKMKTIIL